jgi:hypothetical protein
VSSSVQFPELKAEGAVALRRGEVTEAEPEERPALGARGGWGRTVVCGELGALGGAGDLLGWGYGPEGTNDCACGGGVCSVGAA